MLDLRRRQFITLTTYPDQGLNATCSYSSFDQQPLIEAWA
jgi:hypothetical protein